ncbi:leucine-rich repeat neuronal protein 3-like [Limulus polyphemus]|uniref:Leucine-rich repeat neuronal protein 3-like n=1 Tax=Limulus polyphemus TaxID=6850 RepID=A0ABM1SP46_LIMPO|nr:leucine-rich repeat neuronal protein 3-like [Limulus polyphemus]XP_022245402.1 leucine-rich repeat neuronal protein 3-like [Limulus polyphemus]
MTTWVALAFLVPLIAWTEVFSSDISCPVMCDCLILTVNCSSRGLFSVPAEVPLKTESLLLSENRITDFDNKMPFLPRLLELDLSINQIKQLGRVSIFQNLTELRLLDLSKNKFRTLFNGVFCSLHKLETLVIANGHLKFIDEHVFDDMSMLKHLNLKGNSIHSMPISWFYDLTNLEVLELDHNEIFYLNSDTFSVVNNLLYLSLSHNRIRGINENAFMGLRNLKTLLLNHNHVTEVPSAALQPLKQLKVLVLDANPITQLGTNNFNGFAVEEISLSNTTTLQMVDRGAFRDLINLEKVFLHNNINLQYVDPHAFINVPKLKILLLHKNNLSALSHEIVNRRPTVHLTLYGNPLLCDCNIRWIRNTLEQSDNSSVVFLDLDKLRCSQHHKLNFFPLKSLDLANISAQCEPVLVDSLNETVETKIGESHEFECRAFGIPQPRIYWILPSGAVLNESNNGLQVQGKHPGTLALYHLKPKHSGVYQCVAENKVGLASKNIALQVENVDIGLFPQRVSSTFVTVVWNGTARNNFPEYDILYRIDNQPREKYKTVTVSYVYRSYTINNLEPDTSYKFCIAVKDEEDGDYIQLSCTHVQTRDLSFIMQGIYTSSNVAVAVVLGIVAGLLLTVCFVSVVAKKYRQRHYETPEKSLISHMAHVPPENFNSPLMSGVGSCR